MLASWIYAIKKNLESLESPIFKARVAGFRGFFVALKKNRTHIAFQEMPN